MDSSMRGWYCNCPCHERVTGGLQGEHVGPIAKAPPCCANWAEREAKAHHACRDFPYCPRLAAPRARCSARPQA